MKTTRSISLFNSELKLKGFKAFKIEDDSKDTRLYSRKDFYKICLTTGKSIINYADRSYNQDGSILFFGNPLIPYSWETISRTYSGYTCLFSEDFLKQSAHSESLFRSPFFKIDGTPILKIEEEQRFFLVSLFQKMIEEQESDYALKDELIRNYINLMIHEALKLQPSAQNQVAQKATKRVASVFIELLERQFPIETYDQPLTLKTANDYASNLHIHPNYLNKAVKEITGKSTTSLISERIIIEAKALLEHTDWNISEIAYALGFEYPTYFNNFFKKQTGTNPKAIRDSLV